MRSLLAPLALAMLLGGCTTVRQDFRGVAPEAVWAALVAAAETPEYESRELAARWTLTENNVWPDPEGGVIEVYRRLDRVVHRPRAEPQRQRQTWRFRVVFESDRDPPSALFVSRGLAVPVKARFEGERYFEDVRKLLAAELP